MDAQAAVRSMRMLVVNQLVGEQVGSDQLIRAGLDALLAGVESPSLSVLAGLTRREEPEAREVFDRVVEELGLGPRGLPEEPAARQWALVRWFAHLIASGDLDPDTGGQLIWWQRDQLRPDQLDVLQPLTEAILLHDDEISSWSIWDSGYVARNRRTAGDVIEQARNFLARPESM